MPDKHDERIYAGVLLINILITTIEIAGHVMTGGMMILSDAIHQVGDVFAGILQVIAERMVRKGYDENRTRGWAGIATCILMLASLGGLTWELWDSAQAGHEHAKTGEMALVAGIACALNACAWRLAIKTKGRHGHICPVHGHAHDDAEKNITSRSNAFHQKWDTVISGSICITSLGITGLGGYALDGVLAGAIGLWILFNVGIFAIESINLIHGGWRS